jgi:hypothetical protein
MVITALSPEPAKKALEALCLPAVAALQVELLCDMPFVLVAIFSRCVLNDSNIPVRCLGSYHTSSRILPAI